MRSALRLGAGPGFALDAVTCRDDHRRWSPPEVSTGHRVVLVRRGRFRRVVGGRSATLDPTMAYVTGPGDEERFAHPAGGDVCTSLHLTPALWHTLAGGLVPPRPALYVDARLDVAHRRLLRAARAGDPAFALAEALLPLIAATLTGASRTAAASGGSGVSAVFAPSAPSGGAATRGEDTAALVDTAREAISAGHPAAGDLLSLAALLGVSPFRLSRAFTRELGVSLTHYRNRVRVSRALDRLEQGEPSLATLATDLGFADQAHLTRTVRRHAGQFAGA
ncbi:helix-turn-helix transcriptional regulator, partial [Nonomuraea sp. SBT364]|uniref:helix-turn-helix transcriptional regulator n=1 Tax=Nonomuraea sp. SBT364 TaxID=1580530 RepID=UPI00066DA0AE